MTSVLIVSTDCEIVCELAAEHPGAHWAVPVTSVYRRQAKACGLSNTAPVGPDVDHGLYDLVLPAAKPAAKKAKKPAKIAADPDVEAVVNDAETDA
mgnify:FL=1